MSLRSTLTVMAPGQREIGSDTPALKSAAVTEWSRLCRDDLGSEDGGHFRRGVTFRRPNQPLFGRPADSGVDLAQHYAPVRHRRPLL